VRARLRLRREDRPEHGRDALVVVRAGPPAARRVGEARQPVPVEAPAPVPTVWSVTPKRAAISVSAAPAAEARMICARRTWLYGRLRAFASAVRCARSVLLSVSSKRCGRPVGMRGSGEGTPEPPQA
jgi:hypothetical protein